MPRSWAEEAMSDLVARGIIEKQLGDKAAWDKPVSRYVAAAAFVRACEVASRPVLVTADQTQAPDDVQAGTPEREAVVRCIQFGILPSDVKRFGGKGALTRIEFARWLDRVIGSPAIPDVPPELRQGGESVGFAPPSSEELRHPERLRLFGDLPDTADRATVNRLAWWLILRPPQDGEGTAAFAPGNPVTWNEFVVCLDRSVSFLIPPRLDTSKPEGALAAMVYAVWKCDFAAADRYVSEEPMEGAEGSPRLEIRAVRYSFVDAQEAMDWRVTKVQLLGEGVAQVKIKYLAASNQVERETVTMELRNGVWVFTAS